MAIKSRRVRLPIWGGQREIDLPVPGGQGSLLTVLPAARKLTYEMMRLSEEREAAEGRRVSCKAGCGACCRQLVPISLVEAKSLATTVEKLPPARREAIKRRFQAALARLEGAGLLLAKSKEPRTALLSDAAEGESTWEDASRRYFDLQIACPFLENESCGIYEDRPLICREYLVTSDPALCNSIDAGASAVPRPAFPSRAMAFAAETLDDLPGTSVPLVLSLEWAAARGNQLGTGHTGEEMLEVFLDSLVWGEEIDDP